MRCVCVQVMGSLLSTFCTSFVFSYAINSRVFLFIWQSLCFLSGESVVFSAAMIVFVISRHSSFHCDSMPFGISRLRNRPHCPRKGLLEFIMNFSRFFWTAIGCVLFLRPLSSINIYFTFSCSFLPALLSYAHRWYPSDSILIFSSERILPEYVRHFCTPLTGAKNDLGVSAERAEVLKTFRAKWEFKHRSASPR